MVIEYIEGDESRVRWNYGDGWHYADIDDLIRAYESVQPTEFEWCHDCKEYDQNAHCCHRWTKVIRNTVNDLKTQGYEIVRHGRWIEDEARIKDQCSACGLSVNWSQYKTPYCPFCGAKMDEVD